ncbi:MAG: hypothetical protein M3R13_06735 [Armatimonadota bacterium]|nr:hypothetical protein [Armatimonadota bacterium]
MKFAKKAAIIVAATGLVAAVAWAQGTATLRVKPAVGSKYQYKVTMNTSAGSGAGAGGNMNGTFNQWFIVKSKSTAGTAFEIKVTNAKMTGGTGDMSQVADAMEKQVIKATYSPTGEWVSGEMNSGTMGAMAAQAGLQGIIFPKAPVKIGSTWKATVDIGKMLGASGAQGLKVVSGGKVPVTYKVTGFKKVGAKTVVGISGVLNGTIVMAMGQNKMTMAMKSTSAGQVDVGTGMVRTMTTNANVGTNFGQMKMNQTIKMTMTLL